MTRLHLVYLEDTFADQGLRVVSPDRPGYGRSVPQPGRSMLDWPTDVAEVADALGIGRFVVAAHSSGGAYAVVCAALLSERVSAAVVIAGVTDMGWAGGLEGYVEKEIELMRLPTEEAAIAACVEQFGVDGSGFLNDPFEWSEPDQRALEEDPKFDEAITACMTDAFRQGVVGYAQDLFLQGRPWPFDPSRITVPVQVVHGDADTLVPLAHSQHTAELIPRSTFRTLPGHGHLTILSELPLIASALARQSN